MAVLSSGSPLAARRKLGAELRILRDRLGLTTEEVGTHLNCHNSKVSRVELARRMCTRKDFAALMELYEVDEEKRAELTELATRAMQRIPPWWEAYADVISANYAEFLAYEAEAVRCFEYQPLLIPGLLQTQDYARAITGPGFAALGPDQIDSLTEVRMRRQERIGDRASLALDAVVTEAALRLQVGGRDVMRAQLRHLASIASMKDITFRVIPFSAGENGASTGAFTLFSSGQGVDPDVVFMESAEATTFRDDALVLRRLNRLFGNLATTALSEHDTRKLVERIEKES
ncbi:XRE family transcriptional regulator [Streptomyces sp. AJS327]|uniref:helix-turn-helix domain-containing protein n=1 Tax=Streptomyces sp. AJS327 TaxID=2545265 RepID=UPI0015DF0221|nr:helix-turn-helix transcriptional regulator [Streptomyces sp. AJS327]MBA0053953.1 XRE family transcriptional regulator [Streptomyces sp. AJS327]